MSTDETPDPNEGQLLEIIDKYCQQSSRSGKLVVANAHRGEIHHDLSLDRTLLMIHKLAKIEQVLQRLPMHPYHVPHSELQDLI